MTPPYRWYLGSYATGGVPMSMVYVLTQALDWLEPIHNDSRIPFRIL